MKKYLALILAVMMALTLLAGCGTSGNSNTSPSASPSTSAPSSATPSSAAPSPSPSEALTGNITADGSTALQPLLTLAVDPFKAATGFTGSITINGGGSGQGLTDVASGTVNIGNSDVTPEQAGKDGTGLVDHQVAVVAVGIAVSSDISANIKTISTADLTGIFTGKITDWNKVTGWTGGSVPIQVFYRKAGSGTRTLFETYGINSKLSDADLGAFANFTKKESSGDLQTAIASGKGAIGYETLPYCKDLTLLQVDGIDATYDNVYSGKYAIWGYEHMYTKGEATGSTKAFIDYVISSDFEKTITDNGYGLSSKMTVSR
ncbi:phosphate transport system substrate-binding protein [Sporobacter termitidis DSM 10068]|uniref:Phosphate transport system substrate-binding protein n=1 Tax=Sporobacter termitidis DSM 10068 TaxID=1123282 RepID=A0A1M5Y6N7_9FIRM|nr:substrate-binding domain-containing protein [Sporobacter termitidis]SHI07632.1 phosphate transport system substrate-binding protein [Sporobacter termitidis DSM 10068]